MSLRIALFCSHYYGLSILKTALSLQSRYPHEIEIVGVASDDPTQSFVSPQKRLWQYPHTKEQEEMVADLAAKYGLPVWRDRVKSDSFIEMYLKSWKPDVCYMGVFGQRIPEVIWKDPIYGFYNCHSCAGRVWPSNAGAQAFESMASDAESRGSVAFHAVDNEFDHGPLVAFSEFFPFYKNEGVMETFERTSPHVGNVVGWHIETLLNVDKPKYPTPRVVVPEQLPFAAYADETMPLPADFALNRNVG